MANLVNDGQYFENCELSTKLHFSVCEHGCNSRSLGALLAWEEEGVCPYVFSKC